MKQNFTDELSNEAMKTIIFTMLFLFSLTGISCSEKPGRTTPLGKAVTVTLDYKDFRESANSPYADNPYIVYGELIEISNEWVIVTTKGSDEMPAGEYWLPRNRVRELRFN
jgi:hypothetical protein